MRILLLLVFLLTVFTSGIYGQACTDAESGTLTVTPPLPPGGNNYPAGTVVNMCFQLFEFNTPQANWLHAIIPNLGPGFDVSTLAPVSAPTACSGNGTWGWYDSWTSCNTGLTYGPGFTFDGTAGLGCGGTGNDGDPGNNWGDGGFLCANRIFCWEVTTGTPPSGCNAESYLTEILVYGDGESGSWSNSPCLNDEPLCWPEVTDVMVSVNNPCPGNPFTLMGSFDSEAGCGVLVQWNGPNGFVSNDLITTAPFEGVYTLSVNIDGCTSFDASVTAMWSSTTPTVTPGPSTTFCFGETVTMTAGGGDSYLFTAPDGTTYTNNPVVFTANNTTEGVWQITVFNAPNCEDDLLSEIIVLPQLMPEATVMPVPVCTGDNITLTGSGAGPGGTYTWGGAAPAFTGNPHTFPAGPPGNYVATLTITNSGGCSETIDVPYTISPEPTITISANPMAICEGDQTTITATGGGTYSWSPGGQSTASITVSPTQTTTYTVTVTNSSGCTAEESITIDVQPELAAPMIMCNSTNASNITWTWNPVPGADYYEIYIDGVLVEGFYTSTQYVLNGLDPVTTATIEVIPFSLNNTNCPGLSTTDVCTSPDCNPISFFLETPTDFCYDPASGPILLAIGAQGQDAGNGSISWQGPGIFPPGNSPANWFVPGPGTYTLTATFILDNGSCPYSEDFVFNVSAAASAAINAPTTVCVNSQFTVQLGGAVNPSATYTWDFGTATVISGSGSGPYTLAYPTAGNYTIGLMTSLGNCDASSTVNIIVEERVVAPDVFCLNVGEGFVTFGWTEVPGATGYQVNVISGPSGVQNGNTYEVTGMTPGETTEITVTALSGNTCPNETSTIQSCTAQSCPDALVIIDNPSATFCNDGMNDPIDLTLTLVDPLNPSDTTWFGPGVVGTTFDPDLAGVGVHNVSVSVVMDNCPFDTSVQMTVLALPTATFTVTSSVCIDAPATITYTGDADPNTATFSWNFDGATIISGTGAGPYEISWPMAGSYNVTLEVFDANCNAVLVTEPVDVVAPLPVPDAICAGGSLDEIVFQWTEDPNATGYQVNVLAGPAGSQMGNSYVVTGVLEGEETTIELIALGNGVCGNSLPDTLTCSSRICDTVDVQIQPLDMDFCQDGAGDFVELTATQMGGAGGGTFTWSGPGVSNDTFYVANGNVGANEVIVTYEETGCFYTDTVVFTIFTLPNPNFSSDLGTVCVDSTAVLTTEVAMIPGGSYVWDFDGGNASPGTGAGPHTISWPTSGTKTISLVLTVDGCTDSSSITVEVLEPLPAPTLSCTANDLNSTTVSWDSIVPNTGYGVSVNGGMEVVVTDPTFTVTGLTPDSTVTISVRVLGDPPCGAGPTASIDCAAASCPVLTADFSANTTAFCLDTLTDQSFVLQTSITGGAGGGTFTYTGPGIAGDVFDPAAAGIGVHTIIMTYVEAGPCTLVDSFVIDVFDEPVADFSLSSSQACIAENVTVTFTGTAPSGTVYNWNFDGGTIVSGSGAGPYEINWPAAGTYNLTLSVDAPGNCSSVATPQSVTISAPLAPVNLTCIESLLQSVTFGWDAVPNAYGYEVTYGAVVDTVTDLSFQIIGLDPDQTVTITVRPLGPAPCLDGAPETLPCSTLACPVITVNPSATVQNFCLIDNPQPVALAATSTGGDQTGTFTWSGTGVVDNSGSFTFNPQLAGAGTHLLTVDYVETGNCPGSAPLTMEVFDGPFFTIELSEDTICLDEFTTVSYNGNDLATASLTWNFDGASNVIVGPDESYDLQWAAAGTYQLILTAMLNGCTAMDTAEIIVIQPLVAPSPSCDVVDLTSITFSWPAVIGATGYELSVDNGPTFQQDSLNYVVSGLDNSVSVALTVVALGEEPCGNSEAATVTCTTDPCPNITLNIATPSLDFCLIDNPQAIDLEVSSSGGDQSGTFVWTGTGVVDNGDGTYSFDPQLAGAGAHLLTVDYLETGNCPATASLLLEVFDGPFASIDLSDDLICSNATTAVSYQGSDLGSAAFDWDFGGATSTDLGNETYELNWPTAGTYEVTLTVTLAGCVTSDTVSITVAEPLATPAPSCEVSLTTISFSWPAVAGATAYQLTVNGGTPFTQDSTTYDLSGLGESETVTLTVTAIGVDPCGNSETATIACTTDPCPNVSLAVNAAQTAFCTAVDESPALLELTATGGFGNGTIAWAGAGIVQNPDSTYAFDPNGLPAGTYPLEVTYTESICSFTATIDMQVNASPVVSFNASTNTLCSANSMTVSFNGTAGANAVYNWDFAGANVVDLGNQSYELSWAEAGNYNIELIVTQTGCSEMFSASVDVAEPPVAGQQFQEVEICAGSGEQIELAQLLTGADAGGTWSPGIGSPAAVDAGSGSLNTANLAAGTYDYIYTVPGLYCDDDNVAVSITVQPSPQSNAGPDQTLTCAMGMVSLNGSQSTGGSALTYAWTGPDGNPVMINPTSSMIDVSIPGVYTLTVTSDIGCTATDQVVVTADTEVPVPEVELSNISCFTANDGTILITGVSGGRPPYNYSLNDGAPTANTFFTGLTPGTYSVRVSDANGCFSDLVLDLSRPDELTVSIELPNGNEYEEGDEVVLNAVISGGNTIESVTWQPDSLNNPGEAIPNIITIVADATRTISVTVTDENGCRATDQTTILVRRERGVYIPTGFSPNGDNTNDIFLIGADNDKVLNIQSFLVFNRWGESVFENYNFRPNDPVQGWDGTHRGELMNPAVFVYVAVVEFTDGTVQTFKGDITLIR